MAKGPTILSAKNIDNSHSLPLQRKTDTTIIENHFSVFTKLRTCIIHEPTILLLEKQPTEIYNTYKTVYTTIHIHTTYMHKMNKKTCICHWKTKLESTQILLEKQNNNCDRFTDSLFLTTTGRKKKRLKTTKLIIMEIWLEYCIAIKKVTLRRGSTDCKEAQREALEMLVRNIQLYDLGIGYIRMFTEGKLYPCNLYILCYVCLASKQELTWKKNDRSILWGGEIAVKSLCK